MKIDLLINYQTVKPKKLKFELSMRINESVLCTNFGDRRSRDRESRHKKTLKNGDFGLKSYEFAYNSKTTWSAQLKFAHNVGAYTWFMQTEFGTARSRDQNVKG